MFHWCEFVLAGEVRGPAETLEVVAVAAAAVVAVGVSMLV